MLMFNILARHVARVVPALPACRPMSASTGALVEVSDNDGVAVVTLNRPPVNSLNLDLLQAVNVTLDEVANNKPKGIILTSASPTVFCAGLDITEMFKPDMKRAELFRIALQDTWIKLFGFKFATAAAINGHAPAGGCLLAMSCEYRAMVSGKYTIGLNETALGLVATPWFMDTMTHTISWRHSELALTTAKLFTAEEAFKVGLIDEVAIDKVDAIEKCKKFIQKFDRIPPFARTTTKQRIRQEPLMKMQKNRKQDVADFLQAIQDPQMQQGLEVYMQKLKQKSKNKV